MDAMVQPEDPRLGTVLDRKYRLDRLLGVGGTGTVYAAWHLNLDRPVAVKILHPHFAGQQRLVERFRLEAQYMGLLDQKHVVRVIDFRRTAEGLPYLVMDLVEGETLRQRLRRGPLPLQEALRLFEQLCAAIGQAHERGIVHRDLKPDNLMLQRTPEGEVLKILDFGSSKLLDPSAPQSSQQQAGTPYYMAPERIDSGVGGGVAPDHRVDLFSMGAILYEMLTGRLAYPGETPVQALFKILSEPVPPLGLVDGRLSALLDAVIGRACARQVEDRYHRAGDLWVALAAAARGEADPVAPGGEPLALPSSVSPGLAVRTPEGLAWMATPVVESPSSVLRTEVQAMVLPSQVGGSAAPRQVEPRMPSGVPRGAASLREQTPPREQTPSRAPLLPQMLSGGRALGIGIKPTVMQALAEQAAAEVGEAVLERALGAGWLVRLGRVVATDWVDGAELQALLGCVAAGGDEALVRLGRAFADGVLTTIYKSFLRAGAPQAGLRRLAVMLRMWFAEGEVEVREVTAAEWQVGVRGLRLLEEGRHLQPVLCGFLQRYLELTGAEGVQVSCPGGEAGQVGVKFVVCITGPAAQET